MKKIMERILLAALAVCLLPSAARAADAPEAAGCDGYLVKMTAPPADAGALEEIVPGVYRVDGLSEARELAQSGEAEYIEPNYYASLLDAGAGDWAYTAVSTGYAAGNGLNGAGARIAVIDSGVDEANADLTKAVFGDGYDYKNKTSAMTDTLGHGTCVAQMIAGDDNGLGAVGTAPGATIVPLRCFTGKTDATIADLAQAIRDAVTVYHCGVINMSWGLAKASETLKSAVDEAYASGAVLVAAAGNVSTDAPQGTVMYPAAYDNVIGVGSVDSSLVCAANSQQTSAVALCAPGDGVAAVNLAGTAVTVGGTSFAAPRAAAAAALAMQLDPDAPNTAVAALLTQRARDLGAAGYDTSYGSGLIDLSGMFGSAWACLAPTDGGTILSGWMPGAGVVTAAAYAQNGRMLSCAQHAASDGLAAFRFPFAQEADAFRLFSTDSSYLPSASATLDGS